MHEMRGKEGVVCISVCVDEKEHEATVLKYLRAQKAVFVNYLLDEEPEVWQEKLKITAPPATLVYDREGKLVQRFANESRDEQFTHEDVEKLVEKLISK